MKLEKESIRLMIWNTLTDRGISYPDCNGRIPDFKGSDIAADNLKSSSEWKSSNTIFVSPDTAQLKVRENALNDGKILIMASPKMLNGFIIINPSDVSGNESEASTIDGAFKYGKRIDTIPNVDMVVEGSVAVDKYGGRLGKGRGYGDREIDILIKQRSIGENTPIVSTVHEMQIIDKIPMEGHDQKINMIVTPEKIMRT
jgi:5-formyltetrahydrofolate cyclo-ligase